jgi:hypothetical protein
MVSSVSRPWMRNQYTRVPVQAAAHESGEHNDGARLRQFHAQSVFECSDGQKNGLRLAWPCPLRVILPCGAFLHDSQGFST